MCTSFQRNKCITRAYRLVEKEVETNGKTSLTHSPRCKADALVDKLADRLEKKTLKVLAT